MTNTSPSLTDLMRDLDIANENIKQHGLSALKAEFQAFFESCPEVTSVTWEQYTPYFNDGDACVFRVGDPEFEGDYEELTPEAEERCDNLYDIFYKCEDIFQAAFGDHVQVTATSEGFDVDEYSHD